MRNKKAGKHPSYKKRKMSKASIKKKMAYDKKLSSSTGQKKKRAETNKARRKASRNGENIKGKDASHVGGKIVFKSTKANRGSKSDSPGDRRSRGGKK